jgi:hypothetical protein
MTVAPPREMPNPLYIDIHLPRSLGRKSYEFMELWNTSTANGSCAGKDLLFEDLTLSRPGQKPYDLVRVGR